MSQTERNHGWSHDAWHLPPPEKNSEADWWVPLANNNRTAHPVLHNEQREVSNYVLIPSHISRLDNNPKAV